MARIARIVVPGIPHHIIQRGNRRLPTFLEDKDYEVYKQLLADESMRFGLEMWSYCLMTNHVHLIVVPKAVESLARGIGETHRKYTKYIHFREGWRGYLWQGRFLSYPMDEEQLYEAGKYVELNPVKAHLVKRPEHYRWSSIHRHLYGKKDILVQEAPMLDRVNDWRAYLDEGITEWKEKELFQQFKSGRPLGSRTFIENIERATGRSLKRKKPGPKPNTPRK